MNDDGDRFDGGGDWDPAAVQDMAEAFRNLDEMAQRAGKAMTAAFASGVSGGKNLNQLLGALGSRLSAIALNAALKPLEGAIGSGLESLLKGLGGAFGGAFGGVSAHARGNVFAGGKVQAFARGGVVAAPTYFPMAGGVGLMGERGAEAIMPLQRGADGRLGVAAAGGRGAQVTVHMAARDVDSFRGSQAQIAATLARAVARGQRAM